MVVGAARAREIASLAQQSRCCPRTHPSQPTLNQPIEPTNTLSAGLIDFYLLNPLARALQRRFSESDFTLRDRLGGGNYGQGARQRGRRRRVLFMGWGDTGGGPVHSWEEQPGRPGLQEGF
jgi:hypothetical protein